MSESAFFLRPPRKGVALSFASGIVYQGGDFLIQAVTLYGGAFKVLLFLSHFYLLRIQLKKIARSARGLRILSKEEKLCMRKSMHEWIHTGSDTAVTLCDVNFVKIS